MTNEMLVKEFESNIGKEVLIFLKNNFRYRGRVLEVNERFVKIDDQKYGAMLLSLENVSSVVVFGSVGSVGRNEDER